MHGMTWQEDESAVSQVSMHPFRDYRFACWPCSRKMTSHTSLLSWTSRVLPCAQANVLQRDKCLKIVLLHARDKLYYP